VVIYNCGSTKAEMCRFREAIKDLGISLSISFLLSFCSFLPLNNKIFIYRSVDRVGSKTGSCIQKERSGKGRALHARRGNRGLSPSPRPQRQGTHRQTKRQLAIFGARIHSHFVEKVFPSYLLFLSLHFLLPIEVWALLLFLLSFSPSLPLYSSHFQSLVSMKPCQT
jgi:hypothetical protein